MPEQNNIQHTGSRLCHIQMVINDGEACLCGFSHRVVVCIAVFVSVGFAACCIAFGKPRQPPSKNIL